MAKKKKKGQLSLRLGLNDERIPKLLGLILLFIALVLFVSFTSYLFTWEADQAGVLHFSWRTLLQSDLQMSNAMGRMGAIISNMFFYYGFGLPSYVFVFLLGVYGNDLLRREPLSKNRKLLIYCLVFMVVFSVFLEFVFQAAEFPWGGAFGERLSNWITGFIGTFGTAVLFLFLLVGLIVWVLNPNFNDLTFDKAVKETRYKVEEIISGRGRRKKPVTATAENASKSETKKPEEEKEETVATLRPGQRGNDSDQNDKESQLQFELEEEVNAKKAKMKQSVDPDTELEIQDSAPDHLITIPSESGPTPLNAPKQPEDGKIGEPYDPKRDLSSYEYPTISLLDDYADQKVEIDRAELEANKDQIIATLLNYKIEITKIRATIGPTVTLYEIIPAPGVRISKIKNLEDDIALSLAALGIRIIAPIPGRGTIGIEVPNKKKQIVSLKEVLMSDKFKNSKMDLPIALGKTISNEVFVADLAKMPHLLIAGATGQGKSVGINTILMSILYKKHPAEVKLVLIDPKKVELFPFAKLFKHFLGTLPDEEEPITTETNRVIHTLNSLCIEMDTRYNMLKKAHARNLREYNEKFIARKLNPNNGHKYLPLIVLVIDEFADLIMTAGKEVELPIGRLAQLARAVGIHLIIATQRPSVNIITGVIKANFPARIAYKVTAKVDSRTILDAGGADQLIGRGDMLLSVGGDMIRLQCAFVDTPEVERVISFIGDQPGYPEPFWLPEFHGDDATIGDTGIKYSEVDEMFEDAARLIVQNQHGSTSMIQRRLKLGYNRAGRIMDQLEAMGIVGPNEGSKAREVLIYDEMELERYLDDLKQNKN
ncbi:MAG: DNA translocase FtsK [Bacteroidetes bacterium]|nr:DNA translocase FtsK [Bacteroidota bacterium]